VENLGSNDRAGPCGDVPLGRDRCTMVPQLYISRRNTWDVVYDEKSGHMQKYYKLASTAKRICTQHNTERDYDFLHVSSRAEVGLLLIPGL
jgi:hypothetical protein